MNAQVRPQTRRPQGRQSDPPVSKEVIRRAIKEGDAKALVDTARGIGHRLAQKGLSTSQIRNVFGEAKRMQMRGFDPYKFQLLKPRLAYAAGRHRGAVQDLRDVLEVAIDAVEDEEEFRRFADFFEAILAYHREAGGR